MQLPLRTGFAYNESTSWHNDSLQWNEIGMFIVRRWIPTTKTGGNTPPQGPLLLATTDARG